MNKKPLEGAIGGLLVLRGPRVTEKRRGTAIVTVKARVVRLEGVEKGGVARVRHTDFSVSKCVVLRHWSEYHDFARNLEVVPTPIGEETTCRSRDLVPLSIEVDADGATLRWSL